MKKIFLLLIVLLLSLTAVSAIEIEIEAIKDNIYLTESAEFKIIIKNDNNSIQNFNVYSPEVEWNIPSKQIKAYPQISTEETLEVIPTKYIGPGMYGIKLNFRNQDTNELIEKIIFVNVKSPGEAFSQYKPSIKISISSESAIDPGSDVLVTVTLENKNILDLKDIILRITSTDEIFDIEQNISLKPLETKDIELTYDIDQLQTPGEYKLTVELVRDKRIVGTDDPRIITIRQSTPSFKEEIETESIFFKTVKTVKYTSKSNVKDMQSIKIPASLIKSAFMSVVPEGRTIKEEGNRYFLVDLELSPGESRIMHITTNYRILFYLAVIAVIVFLTVYVFKSSVRIRKGVADVDIKEGGVSALKVLLEIRNVTNKPIKKVAVIDYIPNIADLKKEFAEGTLKPTKVLIHGKKGTILRWELEELGPGEDRLISYSLSSKLSILGHFKLPRAKVIYREKRKERHVYSNTVGINT